MCECICAEPGIQLGDIAKGIPTIFILDSLCQKGRKIHDCGAGTYDGKAEAELRSANQDTSALGVRVNVATELDQLLVL